MFWAQNVSNYDKVRIISLYVMIKNGISEENLTKLFTHAQLSTKDQDMVRNLSFLGINVIADVSAQRNEKFSFIIINYICIISIRAARRSIRCRGRNVLRRAPIRCHVGRQ